MKSTIICIGRQYGSGGREVGMKLAEKLGVVCYDKLIVRQTAKESGLAEKTVECDDEKPIGFGSMISGNIFADSAALGQAFYSEEEKGFESERKTILEIASKGPCVMIGRCASSILRDAGYDVLSVFVYADTPDRIRRICERCGLNERAAARKAQKVDRMRKDHFDFYSETKWGEPESYDLMVSSSCYGIDGTADVIAKAVTNRM